MENKGFSFYQNYWETIQSFPQEQQEKIVWAVVRYAMCGVLPNAEIDPVSYAIVNAFKLSIDKSVARFNDNANANKGGRTSTVDSDALREYIAEGHNAKDCAEKFGLSINAIYKREEWKNRK
jgi:hypothetical protein